MANTTYLNLTKIQPSNPDYTAAHVTVLNSALDALDAKHAYESEAVNGAIGIKQGISIITDAGAAALTLAAPVAGAQSGGGDDGKILRIVDQTGHAHTVTTPANVIAGNKHIATFGGVIGQTALFMAFGGLWVLLADSSGITLT